MTGHTHSHTYTRAYTHTHTHTHTYTHTHVRTCIHMRISYIHIHTYVHVQTYRTCVHAQTDTAHTYHMPSFVPMSFENEIINLWLIADRYSHARYVYFAHTITIAHNSWHLPHSYSTITSSQ